MKHYLDPLCEDYQLRWQSALSRRRRQLGPAIAVHTQHLVSVLRAMRRRLLAGGKPSLRDFRPFRETYPGAFVSQRSDQKLKRAIDRGETVQAIKRRGLLGPLGHHRGYQ